MNSHFFTAPFYFAFIGFRVEVAASLSHQTPKAIGTEVPMAFLSFQ